MRIRKHAARMLSSLSIPAHSVPAAVASAEGRELEMHVCKLNQSPWDVIDFTTMGSVSFFSDQGLEEVEEDSGFSRSGNKKEGEAAAAASDVSRWITAGDSTLRRHVKAEVATGQRVGGEGLRRERREYVLSIPFSSKKRNAGSISNGSNGKIVTKKTRRKATPSHAVFVAAEDDKGKMNLENTFSPAVVTAPLSLCKKNDGKGWHCKRPALHSNSLCAYHLNQVRSYYANGAGHGPFLQQLPQRKDLTKALDATWIPDSVKKRTTNGSKEVRDGHGHRSGATAGGRMRRKPELDFYYYYSGLGPWRGKRRFVGEDCERADERNSSNVDATSRGEDEQRDAAKGATRGGGAPSPMMVHDQAPDDLDDDEEDVDGMDDAGFVAGAVAEDVTTGRRRARKPVKARSLKSLL